MANTLTNPADANRMMFGQYGGTYAATTFDGGGGNGVVVIPTGMVVVAVTSLDGATQLTATAESGFPDPPNAETIPAGVTIYSRFTALTVAGTGGAIIAYFGPE